MTEEIKHDIDSVADKLGIPKRYGEILGRSERYFTDEEARQIRKAMKSNGDAEPEIFTSANRDIPWPEWGDGPYCVDNEDVRLEIARVRLESQYKDDLKVKIEKLRREIHHELTVLYQDELKDRVDAIREELRDEIKKELARR